MNVPAKVKKGAVFEVNSSPAFAFLQKKFEMSADELLCISNCFTGFRGETRRLTSSPL